MWTLDQLEPEIDDIRRRIQQHRRELKEYFVARDRQVDLAILCAITREPLLLVGPPGTAKSDLVVKFTQSLGLGESDYFEYMLTKFTEPSEILGPIDISLLKEGRYVRRTKGMLPECRVAFLDEIFKSNSAILNTLLTILNERKFYQDGQPVPVDLKVLFGATNDLPDQAELAALKDRFCLKVACRSVQDDHFVDLVDAGLAAQTQRDLNQKPWSEGHASLEDLLKAHRTTATDGSTITDRERYFPDEVLAEFRRVLKTLVREDRVFVSDRKVVKLYKLLRAHAWLTHGGRVERSDLRLLSYLGETAEEVDLLEEKVPRLLGLS